MSRIAVVGSINMDLVSRTPKLPAPGETIIGSGFSHAPGGKGANQAAAVGRLGAEVHMVGCVGDDSFGSEMIASLQASGVQTDLVQHHPGPTGIAAIWVDDEGQNSIIVSPGANSLLGSEYVRQCLVSLKPEYVLAQCEIPLEAIRAAGSFGKFILNPAPAADLPDTLLRKSWMLIPNEIEAQQITGLANGSLSKLSELAKKLLSMGPEHVVITLGGQGCMWASRHGDLLHVPALAVRPVDTTGAGDAFVGALSAALADGKEIPQALQWAITAASLSTTRHGAMPSLPTRAELEEALG